MKTIVTTWMIICIISTGVFAEQTIHKTEIIQFEDHNDQQGHWKYIQQGVAEPGSDIHAWLGMRFGRTSKYHAINYKITNPTTPGNPGFSDIGATATQWVNQQYKPDKSKVSNRLESFDFGFNDSGPPDIPGGKIGKTAILSSACQTVGPGFQQGEIKYTWEYQFTKDTNDDGKADSDPEWVITDVEIEFYTPFADVSDCV